MPRQPNFLRGLASMWNPLTATYFRTLTVRCLAIAGDCSDRHAAEELCKLAQEFTTKANELEDATYVASWPSQHKRTP